MKTNGQNSLPTIGFLTVIEDLEQGLFGGYLILNLVGRPLEFHCTAPVRANRAQEILYGPTLQPYLYGERIGKTLVAASKSTPSLVITNQIATLATRDFIDLPMALLEPQPPGPFQPPSKQSAISGPSTRVDLAHSVPPPSWIHVTRFKIADQQIAVAANHSKDQDLIARQWGIIGEQIDVQEPFERIEQAIDEARSAAH